MKKFNIFVSGVQNELAQERFAVKEFINRNSLLNEYFEVFLFEDHPAKSLPASHAYIEKVKEAAIYIGIFWQKYGNKDTNGISATEREFKEAQNSNKEVLIYIKGDEKTDREVDLENLIKTIRHSEEGYTYRRFNDIAELQNNIFESLIDLLRIRGIIGKEAFDQSICDSADINDIDDKKIRWFLEVSKEKRNFPLASNTPIKDVLIHLNLITSKDKLKNSAILLFGKNPQKYVLQSEVKCLQFEGSEVKKPFLSYQIYDGNLFDQIDKAVAFVLGIIKAPVIQQEHTAQVLRPLEIPMFAIEEAIVNAVAHRDYNATSGVQVMCFSDRIEIWNSGSLPTKLSLADLKKPHTSHPANPLIANILYLADYIQRAGTGTIEMVEQCKKNGIPEPEFLCIRNVEFRTILARDIYTDNFLNSLELTQRHKETIKYVKEKGKITNKEYRELYHLTAEGARLDIQKMIQKRILQPLGKGKNRYYVLTIRNLGELGE